MVATSIASMLMNAPLCGTTGPKGTVIHAVEATGIPTEKRKTCDSVCGKRVKIIPQKVTEHDGVEIHAPAQWPPRVAKLAEGTTRCPECFEACGQKKLGDTRRVINMDMLPEVGQLTHD